MGTGRNVPALFGLIGSLKPNVGFLEEFVGNEGLMDPIPLNIVPDDLSCVEGILKDVGDIPFLKNISSFGVQLPSVQPNRSPVRILPGRNPRVPQPARRRLRIKPRITRLLR